MSSSKKNGDQKEESSTTLGKRKSTLDGER